LIRLTEVRLSSDTEQAVLEVLRSGILAQGPKVAEFEAAFGSLVSAPYALGVSSGTSGLIAALQAMRLNPGDEVITTPFTFVATINAAIMAGATVRFADIAEPDFTLDPLALGETITNRTRVIMPVHLYGCPADMPAIAALADKSGCALIEDAAQAHGAKIAGQNVGSWGLAVYSFYATKNIAMGEGGVVTTSDAAQADTLRLLRNQGMRSRYDYEIVGQNYRMTEIQAAIGLSQLHLMDHWISKRRQNAAGLRSRLGDYGELILPADGANRRHVYHQFTIRVKESGGLTRDRLAEVMSTLGVETAVYYPRLLSAYGLYRDHPNVVGGDTPRAEAAAREVLSIPVHQWLEDRDLDLIADAIGQGIRACRRQ